MSKEGMIDTIACGWPESDELVGEGSAEPELSSHQRNAATVLHSADKITGGVAERFYDVAEVARRRLVAVDGDGAFDAVMGAFAIVDMTPAIEGTLGIVEIGKRRSGERL